MAPPQKIKSFSINASVTNPISTDNDKSDYQSNDKTSTIVSEIDLHWNEPVDDSNLKRAWLAFAQTIEKNNARLHSILINQIPTIMDETVVLLKLKNQMQESEIQKEKSTIFTYLKQELKNAQLSLEIEFVKQEEINNKAFTLTDKYKLMLEKSPPLMELKKLFDLDLD